MLWKVLPLAVLLWASAAYGQCVETSFEAFEAQGFKVRQVQVTGPFVGRSALVELVSREAPLKPGAAFTAAAIVRGQTLIREALRNTSSLVESPVHVTVVTRTVSECDQQARELDVVYQIFSTKLRVTGLATGEPRRGALDEPAAAQTVASATARFQVSPLLRYNAAERLVAGARVSWVLPGVFDVFEADVQASNSATYADIRFSGERLTDSGWLRAANWRLAYAHADRPTERETLKTRALVAQVAAVTRPLGSNGAVIKVASLVEGGEQRSTPNAPGLASVSGTNGAFGSWKNAVNLDVQFRRQTLNASYGVQLGFTSAAEAVDYRKHVVDLAYDARVGPTRGWWAHRLVDIVARLGAGVLRGGGTPTSERFFGGNVDVPFLSVPGWTLRGTPVLRSYPAYQLNASELAAHGGDNFVAFNLTTGLPLWVRPLVPAEISNDEEIQRLIDGQLGSAESTLEVVHKSADPAHRAIAASMPELETSLSAIQDRVATLAPTLSGAARASADDCDEQIATLLATIAESRYLAFLADESEDAVSLASLQRVCIQGVNAHLKDADLDKRGREIETTLAFVRRQLDLIDTARAQERARKDMTLPRRTVRAVFEELNAVSIGPMLMVDAARLADRAQVRDPPLRVGVGSGVRISIVNTLHLSTGYLWNVSRATSAERPGAAFAVLEFTTLLGR
jgi:hypothetical protein